MNNRIEQLTFTRFISAFLILIEHYDAHTLFDKAQVNVFFPFFGVSYFFTLSGFVLTVSYFGRVDVHNWDTLKKYCVSRIARVYPIYLVALMLVLLYFFNYDKINLPNAGKLALNIFLLQGWILGDSINFPSWSLSCEIFFYTLFPFILNYVKDWSIPKIIQSMIAIWIVQQIACYLLFTIYDSTLGIKFHPVLHLPTFLVGVFLGLIFRKTSALSKVNSKTINYVLVFIIVNELLNRSSFGFEVLSVPLFVSFIYFASTPDNFVAKYFKNKYFIALGNISYAIYILQVPVALLSGHFFDKYQIRNLNERFVIFVALVLISSSIAYFFVEKPIYTFVRKKLAS